MVIEVVIPMEHQVLLTSEGQWTTGKGERHISLTDNGKSVVLLLSGVDKVKNISVHRNDRLSSHSICQFPIRAHRYLIRDSWKIRINISCEEKREDILMFFAFAIAYFTFSSAKNIQHCAFTCALILSIEGEERRRRSAFNQSISSGKNVRQNKWSSSLKNLSSYHQTQME